MSICVEAEGKKRLRATGLHPLPMEKARKRGLPGRGGGGWRWARRALQVSGDSALFLRRRPSERGFPERRPRPRRWRWRRRRQVCSAGAGHHVGGRFLLAGQLVHGGRERGVGARHGDGRGLDGLAAVRGQRRAQRGGRLAENAAYLGVGGQGVLRVAKGSLHGARRGLGVCDICGSQGGRRCRSGCRRLDGNGLGHAGASGDEGHRAHHAADGLNSLRFHGMSPSLSIPRRSRTA